MFYDVSFRYTLLPEVGRGSFGIVRKVQDKRTKKYFACKTLNKAMNTPIHLLRREIASLEGLHHPHVIELQAVYEESRYIHIVTELCTGGELYERVGAGNWSITETEAAELMHNILRAIAYIHHHGIIHRDLKACNFLFVSPDTNTNVKIIDFGLARTFSRTVDRPDDHDGTMMDESAWVMKSKVGTPYYVAPEILTEEYYTSKCDIWSIGVVAYLVLSGGSLPFCGKDERETLQLLRDPELEVKFDPVDPWSDFDESAKDFCIALLQKDPARRPSAEEALEQRWLRENYRDHQPEPALASNPKLIRHQRSAFRGRQMIEKYFRKAKSLES
jgi:serine/threonine protein kinase